MISNLNTIDKKNITTLIGLGNPGRQYSYTRHNIGFMVLDALADKYNSSWASAHNYHYAEIMLHGTKKIILIKPQTFMNSSGQVMTFLSKKGIKAENILVIHDELEKSFGIIRIKQGGSAKGHNGLRSFIGVCGPDFMRLQFGIGRPERKEDVGSFVLTNFSEKPEELERLINESITVIENSL